MKKLSIRYHCCLWLLWYLRHAAHRLLKHRRFLRMLGAARLRRALLHPATAAGLLRAMQYNRNASEVQR